jgi:hypothetical protein
MEKCYLIGVKQEGLFKFIDHAFLARSNSLVELERRIVYCMDNFTNMTEFIAALMF